MRLDAQHPGYIQDDSRLREVDPLDFLPPLPEVAPEVPLPVLVDGDFIDGFSVRGAGMSPFFGVDGFEPLPSFEYLVGFDGAIDAPIGLAPAGPEPDGFNARGAAFARVLISEPIGPDFDQVAPHRRTPIPAPSSYDPGDLLEPRPTAFARTGSPPQLGLDGPGQDPPGFDIRLPIVGTDEIDYTLSTRRPTAAPEFTNTADGFDRPRRRLRFAS